MHPLVPVLSSTQRLAVPSLYKSNRSAKHCADKERNCSKESGRHGLKKIKTFTCLMHFISTLTQTIKMQNKYQKKRQYLLFQIQNYCNIFQYSIGKRLAEM